MPFHKIQGVLKRALPEKTFDELYKVACNGFDMYQSMLDTVYYNLPTSNEPEELKRRTLRSIKSYTMTSRVGLISTYNVVVSVINENIAGAFVECGVARGGCSALMAILANDENAGRKTWLLDSFEGLPEQTDEDGVQKPIRHKGREANDLAEGYCLGTLEAVEHLLFHKLGLNYQDITMIKGWFQDTLPFSRDLIGGIAVLRLDGDWYESTKCCFENLYGNVVSGGYVIIDDYQLAGCKLAVDEFIASRGLDVQMTFDVNGRGYWIK